MIISLTPGIVDDISLFQNHPHAKYTLEDINTQYYPSGQYSNIDSLFFSTAKEILKSNLLENEYRASIMARTWVSTNRDNDTVHLNSGERTSDWGQWYYMYATISKVLMHVSTFMPTNLIAFSNSEQQLYFCKKYFSEDTKDYVSTSGIVNSTDESLYKLVFPANKDMFGKDVRYIIPVSLLK